MARPKRRRESADTDACLARLSSPPAGGTPARGSMSPFAWLSARMAEALMNLSDVRRGQDGLAKLERVS
eukprot:COSAG02_NODE_1604_length_11728_cov_42.819417_7_plen_69_part_00